MKNIYEVNIHKFSKKKVNKIHSVVRAGIQLFYFIFFPSVYVAAFTGIKYIFNNIGLGQKIEYTSFVSYLVALCIYTFVFGRFFCGFACAFGTLGDFINFIYTGICKKIKIKPIKISDKVLKYMSYVKYIILFVIVMMCFENVYSYARGTSPWEVFSMLYSGNFKLKGYVIGIILLGLIIIGMGIQERFFCRCLCPMGAIFSILPQLPFFTLRRSRDNCINACSACSNKCQMGVEITTENSLDTQGECIGCQKCVDVCPKGNIHLGIKRLKGNEIGFTVIKAIILLILLIYL